MENENVNCERSQQDDQRGIQSVLWSKDFKYADYKKKDNHFVLTFSHADNDVAENEDVNCERSQKDDQRGIKFYLV